MTMTVRSAPPTPTREPQPLKRNTDFRRLWWGQGVSELGSSAAGITMPLLMLSVGYSTAVVGGVSTVVLIVGVLAQMPAGFLADRFDQRRVMLACDLVRAGATAALVLCALLGVVPLWTVLAVTVVSQLGLSGFRPAQTRALRRVVPEPQMTTAVSVNQARGYAIGIVGPTVGGLLFTVGPALPFAVNTATFLVSALFVAALRTRLRPDPEPQAVRFLPAVGEGWRHLWHDRFLRWSTLYFTLVNFAFSALMYIVILGLAGTEGGALTVGAAVTTASVAGLLGSLVTPAVQRRAPVRVVLLIGPAVTAALLFLAARHGGVILLVTGFAVLCFVAPMCGALLTAVRMLVVPERVLGRVVGATSFLGQALQPLAPLTAGLLLAHLSRGAAVAVLGATFAATTLVGLLVPAPRVPEHPGPPTA
jgi:MFS family permease